MKTTKTAIHKLTIQADCGCIAFGEYKDEALKQVVAGPLFTACATHREEPGASVIGNLMKEMVTHTAAETKIAPPVAPAEPAPAPAHLDDSTAARRAARLNGASPAAASTVSAPAHTATVVTASAAQPAAPAQAGSVTRMPIAARPGSNPDRRPGTKQPMVVGGKPGGVRRHDPAATGQATARGGLKVASGGGGGSMDMDGVPEDTRVTALLEHSGVLDVDLDGDDGGIEFD